jgi:1,4-dihydroxy-2-naphthoate octaprenyltransferase
MAKHSVRNIPEASIKDWISAFRLRTLPLALASIALGGFLAAVEHKFRLSVFLLSALTTILLQILSNLANDYGDAIHGADLAESGRKGPQRAVSSGVISASSMLKALVVFAIMSFVAGTTLLLIAFDQIDFQFLIFIILGLLAIAAAIKYTAGSNPYGYAGLGDVSVLLFFGLIGVLGSSYLHANSIQLTHILPALSCGFFATAVLNVNNIRDIDSDLKAGKLSIPVRIGRKNALIYHAFLLTSGVVCAVVYVMLTYKSPINWLFLVSIPLMNVNLRAVMQKTVPAELDPYLKQMALTTLLFVVSFGLGQIL